MNIQRGEVLRVNLNPTQGREQQGNARPCLIISHTKFNKHRNGLVIAMPITNTLRPEIRTMIPLPSNVGVHGSVIVEQVRTIDLQQRWWKSMGVVLPKDFVDGVVEVFNLLIQGA